MDTRTEAQGQKSLYYSNGILEGTETIIFFVLLCLMPTYFVLLAWVFGAPCFATATLRIYAAKRIYTDLKDETHETSRHSGRFAGTGACAGRH